MTKARFPRSARLLRHADFEPVYKRGKRHFDSHMTVFYLYRLGAEDRFPGKPRIGFTVSRALGGAVERNRMRRRLREAVRENFFRLGVAVDVVINPKKSLLQAEFRELLEEVEHAFEIIQKSASRT